MSETTGRGEDRDVARMSDISLLTQRLDDLRSRVTDLAVAATSITRIEVTAIQLQAEILAIRKDLAERDKETRDTQVADRRANRTAIYSMTIAIIATIIAGVITMLVAVGTGP